MARHSQYFEMKTQQINTIYAISYKLNYIEKYRL